MELKWVAEMQAAFAPAELEAMSPEELRGAERRLRHFADVLSSELRQREYPAHAKEG